MSKIVRFLVIALIAILISAPLIAGGHKYIAPPVIFVHGFNANSDSWENTKTNLKYLYVDKYGYQYDPSIPKDQKYFPLLNYGADKLGEFSKNGDCTKIAVNNEPQKLGLGPVIYNAIGNAYYESGQAHKPGHELVSPEEMKVILVCHSFGGLVTRSLLKQNETANPILKDINDDPLPANYFQSHIAKVIFVGTPHQGSPLASALWILKEVEPQLGALENKYRNRIVKVGFHGSWYQNLSTGYQHTNMYLQIQQFHNQVKRTLSLVDVADWAPIVGKSLDIDPYGKAIEQCRLNKTVSFNRTFTSWIGNLSEDIFAIHNGAETFLGQGGNLAVPNRFSTIYAETDSTIANFTLAPLLKKLLFSKYFSFPAGEDIDSIVDKGDVIVSNESQRLAGAVYQYPLSGVAHFDALLPGESYQYATIREALCEDAPIMKIEQPFVSNGNVYSRQIFGRVRDYLPLDCGIAGKIERLSAGSGWQWQDVNAGLELNPNYEETKDNFQGVFGQGSQLPLTTADYGQRFKLTLKPVNAANIAGAEQSLTFTYACFIDTATVYPKDGAVGVDPAISSITIPVKEKLRTESVTPGTVILSGGIPYRVTAAGAAITIWPEQPLQPDTWYTVTLNPEFVM